MEIFEIMGQIWDESLSGYARKCRHYLYGTVKFN